METEATQVESLPLARDVAQLMLEQLAPEERIVWAGRPRAGAYLGQHWVLVVVAGAVVVSLALVVVTIGGALTASRLTLSELLAGLVAVVLLLMFTMLCLGIRRQARHTGYAITDRRAITLSAWPRRKAFSFPPEMLQAPSVRVGRKGRGTVVLTEDIRGGSPSRECHRAFVGVDGVARVANMLRALGATACPEKLWAYTVECVRPPVTWIALVGVGFGAFVASHVALVKGFPACWEEIGFLAGSAIALVAAVGFVRSLMRMRAYKRLRGTLPPAELVATLRASQGSPRVHWGALAVFAAVAMGLFLRARKLGGLDAERDQGPMVFAALLGLFFLWSVARWRAGKGPQRPPEDLLP